MLLLDTDICIRFLRGDRAVIDRMREVERERVRVSMVTIYELRVGIEKSASVELREKKEKRLRDFRQLIEVVSWGEVEASESAKVRAELEAAGKGIGPYDVLLAATARANGWKLITGNLGEFGRVAGLNVEDWSPGR